MMIRRWLCMYILLVPTVAWGQACSYSVTPTLDFGTVAGLPTPQVDVTADITVQCPVLSLLQRRVCIGMPVGSGGITTTDRRLVSGGFDVPFNIYRNAARTQVWGSVASGQQVQMDFPTLVLNPMTATVHGRVFGGTSGISVGTYQSVFSSIEVREGTYTLSPPSCSALGANTLPGSMTAQLTIEPDCTITASPLDFGVVTNIVQTDANTNLSVNCTLNGAYSVSLDGGTTTGDVGNRQMQLGAATIDYQLYRDPARTLIWGDTPGTTVDGTGSSTPQSITVYGRVPPQGPKPTGSYQDTVTATVEF